MNAHIYIRIYRLYTHSSSAVFGLLHFMYLLVQFKKYLGSKSVYIYIYIYEGIKWEYGEIRYTLEVNAHEIMKHQSRQVIGRT